MVKRLEMKNYSMILTEKLQKYQVDHQVKYEYLTGEGILPLDQNRVIEKATFTYSSLVKALEKQTKTIKYQGKNKLTL